MTGVEAARLFYGGGRMTRKRAIPRPTLTLLQDFGSAAGLDGDPHRHRKAMLMSTMGPESLERLAELSAREWRALARGARGREVVLEQQAHVVLCRAACAWTGVPLAADEAPVRAAQLAALWEGAGALGPRQVRGQLARRRVRAWLQSVVARARRGELDVAEGSPLHTIVTHRGLDGRPLTVETAEVELRNLLRPTVAVARFVTFAALALHEHPEWRERLRERDAEDDLRNFVQEVRRTAPFFPVITGRVDEPFELCGERLERGTWAMLDLYGTNHDPRAWERPEEFDPERFRDWDGDPFSLIPQGGGDHLGDHRCAGEWATIRLLEVAVAFLARELEYEVPAQDLRVPLHRIPAKPRSGFVIRPTALQAAPPLTAPRSSDAPARARAR